MNQPLLHSERLLLRPLDLDDAPRIQFLAGNINVVQYTLNIPHPYSIREAEIWIQNQYTERLENQLITYAVVIASSQLLIGAASLDFEKTHATLGYWIGEPYWNQGYCTEAVKVLLDFGLNTLHLPRIQALHLSANPASGKVMQKAGMILLKKTQSIDRHGAQQPACLYSIGKTPD